MIASTATTETRPSRSRVLSFSEISTALTCFAQWSFRYGGHLTDGQVLKPKEIAPTLSEGRAWGAGVARWHEYLGHTGESLTSLWAAHEALRASLEADAKGMEEAGSPPRPEAQAEMAERLGAMLDHYAITAEPLPNLTKLEGHFEVPLPARAGPRTSSRYRFEGYVDGWTEIDGQAWVIEFKLRRSLSDPRLIERQRQHRWYAWALNRAKGIKPIGVIVDERLAQAPKPARLTDKGRKPSHAKDQLTTADAYIDLCLEYDDAPKPDVIEALRQRSWQQRFPLIFREGELEEAGKELTSAAKLIRDLDSGELAPIRNANRMTCGYCAYSEVCSTPQDRLLLESLFSMGEPKRFRLREEARVG